MLVGLSNCQTLHQMFWGSSVALGNSLTKAHNSALVQGTYEAWGLLESSEGWTWNSEKKGIRGTHQLLDTPIQRRKAKKLIVEGQMASEEEMEKSLRQRSWGRDGGGGKKDKKMLEVRKPCSLSLEGQYPRLILKFYCTMRQFQILGNIWSFKTFHLPLPMLALGLSKLF